MLIMNYEKYALIDLHLHLDGSLSPEIIIEIAKEEKLKLPSYEPNELRKYLEVPENCQSLNEYLTRFDIPNLVLQTKNGLRKCLLDLLKREANDGLKYVEIRMAPQLSTAKGLSQEEVVQELIKAKEEAQKLYGIKSNLILCLMRGNNNNVANLETVKIASKYLHRGVVALDLAGAEALFPNEMFADMFLLANNLEIPFTLHAGEAAGADSVRSAISYGAKRIGHGINSIHDEQLMKYLADEKIPLEICPKSNLDTKTIKSFDELPIKEFLNRGIMVTINTDDMTVSNTNLKNEYKIMTKIGLTDKQMRQIAINSINAAFINEAEKKELLMFLN
jgi:adenosine deaminase